MKVNDLKAILRFGSKEEAAFGAFSLPKDAFYPMILSMKLGGAWSYSPGDLQSISVMKVFTSYDENLGTGHTVEEVYLLLNPGYVSRQGTVKRLERCGNRDERMLVTRPYSVTLRAERIFMASICTDREKILIRELEEKEISFTGPSAFYADHEMEHLSHAEIEGSPFLIFDYEITNE